MELIADLVDVYFKKQISIEVFIDKLGIYEDEFSDSLLCEMVMAFKSQDAERLGYLIYALSLWDDRMGEQNENELEKFLDILNELLISNWHYKHEDITWFLQKISSDKSIKYLYDAIELHPEYLAWDDNYSFEVKCVRGIYYIGREKSYSYLEKLCKHSNEVIREMAQRQIKKIDVRKQVDNG